MIRPVKEEDSQQICDIYNYHVENTIVTFEEEIVSSSEMQQRIKNISSIFPWIVYEEENEVIGYAYAAKWRERYSYRFSVETTVYVNNNYFGKGIGQKLYKSLIDELKSKGFHVALGVISLPNESSIKLHEKLGFKKAAHFHEVGYKFDKWIDVGYWELAL